MIAGWLVGSMKVSASKDSVMHEVQAKSNLSLFLVRRGGGTGMWARDLLAIFPFAVFAGNAQRRPYSKTGPCTE